MTKIVIASDSFKGSMRSLEVARAVEKGIRRVENQAVIKTLPIADGGEGTVNALVQVSNGKRKSVEVTDPYNRFVTATYGLVDEGIAVIEMAEASGLHLRQERDSIWDATTYGTGELILAALEDGVKEIYIGLGGSATNDGGAGMIQALGGRLFKENGEEIGLGAKELSQVVSVDLTEVHKRLKGTVITMLSDVTNPLLGDKGASAIFGPQKGASKEAVKKLDEELRAFKDVIEEQLKGNWSQVKGAGAAGGLGFGLLSCCQAKCVSGIDKVLELIGLEKEMEDADLVITGEGQMDGQSLGGKAPVGVAKLAKKYNVPVAAIVGSADKDLSKIYEAGIDLVIDIIHKPMTLEEAIFQSTQLIERAGETVIRAYKLGC